MTGNDKKNIVFGVISLFVSAILQAIFSCYLQNGWIVLVFTCIYAVMFLKYLKGESVVKWLNSKVSKKVLKVVGAVVLFIGIAFLSQASGQQPEIFAKFMVSVVSYICWMLGLLLIDIANEWK